MKRLWLARCILLFSVGIFVAFPTANVLAQSNVLDPAQAAAAVAAGGVSQQAANAALTPQAALTPAQVGAALSGNAIPSTAAAPAEEKSVGCSIFGKSPIQDCLTAGTVWLIKNIFLNIAGVFLWMASHIFDMAVQVGVLGFSKWAPVDLYPIWLMVRQIVSLFVVFIGLYLGFMFILGKDEKFKKYIPWVIMFALFVNFSYPLVRTAIDISNIVTLNIYTSVIGSGQSGGDVIVGKLGLSALITSSVQDKTTPDMLKSITTVPAALLAVVYVLFASYIFIMAAAIFMMRTIALVFLIVASPILLIDSVFPMLGDRAMKLREILFSQLAVAPIFMIMFALTVRFLDIFKTSADLSGTNIGADVVGNVSYTQFFNILMMLIMLWVMLKVTKSASGSVGAYVSGAVGKVGGYAAGAATGGAIAGAGILARKGIGGAAAKLRDSTWVTNNQDKFIGRRAYNLSNSVANSTFDARNTAVAQKYAGKMGISSGMGAGGKLGFDEEKKKKLEDLSKRGSRIKTKYERDVIKDGKVDIRKGEVNEEGVAAKERFYQNKGGAIFMTKEQQAKFNEGFIDESSSADMEKFNKLTNKKDKASFIFSLNKQLEDLRKEEGGDKGTPKQKALMRTIYDIEKKDKDDTKTFEDQVTKSLDKFFAIKSPEKRDNFLANLDKEVRDEVASRASGLQPRSSRAIPVGEPAPTTPNPASQTSNQPLTSEALRQERLQKVAEGRANNVNIVEGFISENQKTIEKLSEERKQITSEYEKKIADLNATAEKSSIVDSRGNTMISSGAQKEIDAINQQKERMLKNIDNEIEYNKQLWGQSSAAVLTEAKAKQQGSATRFDISQISTQSFAQGVTAKKSQERNFDWVDPSGSTVPASERRPTPAQTAQLDMARTGQKTLIQVPGEAISGAAGSTEEAANQPKKEITA